MSTDSPQANSGRRSVITCEMLSAMKKSYFYHFSGYCNQRKHVTQRLPAQVWRSVYEDIKERPGFQTLKEDSLKKRLKVSLSNEAENLPKPGKAELASLVTGVNDSELKKSLDDSVLGESDRERQASNSNNSIDEAGFHQEHISSTPDDSCGAKHTKSDTCQKVWSPSGRSSPDSGNNIPAASTAQGTSIAMALQALLMEFSRRNEETQRSKKRSLDILQNSFLVQKRRLEIEEKHYRRHHDIDKRRLQIEEVNSEVQRLVLLYNHGILDKEELLARLNLES